MSEQPSQDGPPTGTPSRDILLDPLVQEQDCLDLQEHEEQHHHELVQAKNIDGDLSLIDDDDVRKMSQDSLISGSGRGSPLLRPSAAPRRYQDSDSCPSVSPSPDPESRLQSFDFSPAGEPVKSGGITAALQTEREFLDFMLSLPQVQKEGPGRPSPAKKDCAPQPNQQQEGPKPVPEEAPPPVRAESEQRCPSQAPATVGAVVSTKMGLDHLDNLCRMMEQLGDLKEQNSRLQRRVHYLEELQALQEMHRHLQETLEARRSGLRLDSIHLSDSDPHLDDDGEGGGGGVSHHGSEDSMLLLGHHQPDKGQLLDLPESPVRRHSTSDGDHHVATLDREPPTPAHDKEKKGHRSAWGMVGQLRPRWTNWGRGGPAGIKVKNMISTRRDSVRKKSSSAHRKSTVERPGRNHTGVVVEVAAASDPEDYEVDYDGQAGEPVDPGGLSCFAMDASDVDWEIGGVWVGPPEDEVPTMPSPTTSLGVRRSKPQLTITVPSSEDLSLVQQGREKPRPPPRSPEIRRRKNSPSQLDPRTPLLLPRTPPSPRRASHWTKVKKAFLTGQQHQHIKAELQVAGSSSLPPSPSRKTTTFHFDAPPDQLCVGASIMDDSSSPSISLEASPDALASHSHSTSTPSPQPQPTPSPQPSVQRNLADLQKSLSGEFNRRLQEWEKLKSGASQGGPAPAASSGPPVASVHPEENLPHEFRKKLHEWEKMKERERERGKTDLPRGQEDVKTKVHGEDDLPADFRKKLTEWEIRKALVGKSQQNVEELQKNLGEEFNRKMAEWERIKASASHGQIKTVASHLQVKPSASVSCIQANPIAPPSQVPYKSGSISGESQIKSSASTSHVLVKGPLAGPGGSPILDRKGSGHKIKKSKANKTDKAPVQSKGDGGNKGRDKSDKELQWLEKELLKVEREKQRLERDKEKFLERQARLEKMRQAMARGGPAKKKEIYIKTSTGEFRFEGISQTFTKKLYEWEERRGIRPESSTIALLDPNYKAPEKEVQEKPKSPEVVRLVRSKSESSMVADLMSPTLHSRASSLSLGEREPDESLLQADNKAASEPTLAAEDSGSPKVAMLVQLEEVVDDLSALHDPTTPYAPAEITRNIDSSGSEEDVTRRRRADDDDDDLATSLQRNDSGRGHGSYRSLLHENMSLLDKLRRQEDLCRALETQMGDIDSKMDNVADQHLKTLEKLHRQVTIMKDSSDPSHDLEDDILDDGSGDAETNQRLINQLKSRIVELEMRGDHLMNEKEQLERAFKLHKDHETEIAESLVERIRELQNAGAEVNIQTVQCQSSDVGPSQEGSVAVEDPIPEGLHKQVELKEEAEKVSLQYMEKEREQDMEKEREHDMEKEREQDMEKEREKRKKSSREAPRGKEVEAVKREKRTREPRKTKKVPSKKVQKLHNLTGDLLFQAKRLEQALVSKHGLDRRGVSGSAVPTAYRQMSLRGRSSLRLVGDKAAPPRRGKNAPARTWSSIEAITFPTDSQESGEVEDGIVQKTGESDVMTSRSLKGQSSTSSHSCDPQELLAMNAELSRMAKELRLEMMQMWSFRDSTSPESVTSEPMSVHDMEENTTEKDRLVAEANEVFQSIAMLHKDSPPPSPHITRSPSSRSRKSPTNMPHSKLRDPLCLDEKWSCRGAEDTDRRFNNNTPSRKNSYRQQQRNNLEEDEDEEELEKEPDISVFGATLGELLLRTQHHHEDEEEDEEEEEEEEDRPWEGQRRRSSDGLSTVTSGPSRSHSPSPSIASSAAEAESSSRVDEDEDSISLPGTWRTATTSTMRSGEHMLSSSFEWEEEDAEERKKPRARWRAVLEDTEDEVEEQRPRGRWKAVVEDVDDDTAVQKPKRRWKAVVDEEEEDEDKEEEEEEEEEDEEEEDGKETPTPQKTLKADNEDCTDFVTEVTVILPSARRATRDLKTRRISDTQVEYENFGPKNRKECFADTASNTEYDEVLAASRQEKIGGVISSPAVENTSWRGLEVLPSASTTNAHQTMDKSPDIFVPTKRTIFTVQGGNRNRDQARATPTFVESQDEEQEAGRGAWRRSQSHPDNVSEAVIQKPTRPIRGKKANEKNMNGHHCNTSSAENKAKNMARNSKAGTLAKASQVTKKVNQSFSISEPKVDVRNEEPDREITSSQKENSQIATNNTKEQNEIEDKSTGPQNSKASVKEGTLCVEETTSHLPPPQPLTTTAITTALLQTPTLTSPPIESKREVLEAVNEGVPAVRNIIQKFNKRITENQELLGSPFRSPPSSPPWQSPRSQRKLLADLNSYQAGADHKFSSKNAKSTSESYQPVGVNSSGGVLKSQSASVIVSQPELPLKVQRSASGSCVQENKSINNDVKINVLTGLIASPQLSRLRGPSPGEVFNYSSSVSPAVTDLDTSCDLELSTDDTGQRHERLTSATRPERRSPAAHIRALRIKKAKEEFLARGAGLPTLDQRSSDTNETVKLRHRSGTASTEGSWRESDELRAGAPSPTPTEGSSHGREETRDKPPRVASRRRNIPKKESFRRQSAGCLLEESASGKHPSQVVKSSSSGVLGNVKRHSRYSIDSQSPDRRKDSVDPSSEHTRTPLGIFKLFRRNRSKDKRDMPSVQKLCRQSLVVDFANSRDRTQSASPQPGPEPHLRALPEVEIEEAPEAAAAAAARSSKTLPRGSSMDTVPLAPSRSCPSSPVAPHRSRTANWLARGRQIFNSRSPSPGKKTR